MPRIGSILAFLALISALLVAAALLVPHVVETAAARRAIADWLENRLGREVAIDGPMRFTVLPMIGFVIQDLSVAGRGGLAEGAALKVERAEVAVAPMPLFRRRVVFERIRIQSPQVDLRRDLADLIRWRDLAGHDRERNLAVEKKSAAILFQFERITIENGLLRIRDTLDNSEIVFSRIGFKRRGRQDRHFVLDARVAFARSPVTGLDRFGADLHMTGAAVVDPELDRYTIDDAHLSLSLDHQRSNAPVPLATLQATVSADGSENRLTLENLLITGRGASLFGSAGGRLENGKPSLAARLKLKIEALDTLLTSIGFSLPPRNRWLGPRTADLDLELSATAAGLTLSRIRGRIDQMPLEAEMVVATGKPVDCKVHLRAATLDLDPWWPSFEGASKADHPALPSWLSLDLTLDAEALVWRQYRIDRARLKMRTTPDNGMHIETASGHFAGGTWHLDGKIQAQDKTLAAALTLAARDISVASLWPAGTAPAIVRGRVNVDAQMTTRGIDSESLYQHAAGKVRIATRTPLQVAESLQTKVQGHLEADLRRDRHLTLTSEWRAIHPDLKVAVNTEGTWDPQALALESDKTTLEIDTPLVPGPDSRLILNGALSLSIPRRQALWRRIRLSGLGLTAGGKVDLNYVDERPLVKAHLNISPLDPWAWFAKQGIALPVMADSGALKRAALKTALTWDGKSVSIRDLELTVDDTRLRGIVDIAALQPLQVHFMLDADQIDLDRYLATDHKNGRTDSKRAATPAHTNPIDIGGTLTVARLRLFDLDARDVFAEVAADRAAVRLDTIRLALYDGTATGRLTVAIDGSDPVWQTVARVEGAQLRQPLETIFGFPVLSGRADIRATLAGRNTERAKTVAGLDGNLDIVVRDGCIHGMQIVPQAISRQEQPSAAASRVNGNLAFQPFDSIEGRWSITDGVAVTEDHRLSGPYLTMTALGRVDFVQERLDATLLTDVSGIPLVYYAIDGPFGDIRVKMNHSRLVLDTTTGIITSPLKLGQGTLGMGVEIMGRGSQAIGDGSGVQQVGQGALTVGKGVLEVGKGVLELNQGGDSLGKGAKSMGQGVYGLGKGVVGVGKDVLDAGIMALEGFGKGLERLLGGRAPNAETDLPAAAQTQ